MTSLDRIAHPAGQSVRRIVNRTRGRGARFISPDELGHVVKPFVYLDLFDKDGPGRSGAAGRGPSSSLASDSFRHRSTHGSRGRR